ncbi:PhoH family protein [Alphaproteobacteria bacterium]|nr:PhoH family protein [Alphaproteobacteria bacterium]
MKPETNSNHSITLEFDDNQVLPLLYGHHNSNLSHIEKALDVRLDSFGNIIQISGTTDNATMAKHALEAIYKRIMNTKGQTDEAPKGMIDDALRWARSQSEEAINRYAENASVISTWKKTITAKSKTQQDYLDAIAANDLVFGVGPAGTGKTYLAVARAVEALKSGQVERIILSRPAVEAGERLGFLPGDMKEKVDPYLRPLYDAIYDMMPPDKMDRMMASGQIEIAPLAFMRGRTLAQSFVIIDEAQNTTAVQMKMVLTRLGDDSKMVITGDLGQIDLPSGQTSGLADAVSLLDDVKGINITTFTGEDVVRHPIVARILKAYDKRDQSK